MVEMPGHKCLAVCKCISKKDSGVRKQYMMLLKLSKSGGYAQSMVCRKYKAIPQSSLPLHKLDLGAVI